MKLSLNATCYCNSAVIIRAGAVVCASCGAAIVATQVSASETYSTEPGEWPEGCPSRRAARDRLRDVPGVEVIGQGRGTIWRVSKAAYAAHYARSSPARPVDKPRDALTDEQIADMALEAAGVRSGRVSDSPASNWMKLAVEAGCDFRTAKKALTKGVEGLRPMVAKRVEAAASRLGLELASPKSPDEASDSAAISVEELDARISSKA